MASSSILRHVPHLGVKVEVEYIAAWTSLEAVDIGSSGRTVVLQCKDIVAHLYLFEDWNEHPYWYHTIRRSRLIVWGNIRGEVYKVGRKRTKEWLCVRTPGDMAEGFEAGMDYHDILYPITKRASELTNLSLRFNTKLFRLTLTQSMRATL